MIYVTVGNHDQPFDRLLTAMDRLAAELDEEVVMQTGVSQCRPVHAKGEPFFPYDKAEEMIRAATAVVAHAGIGTVIACRAHGTPLVICPRRAANGEHFNDHQLEIARELIKNPRPGIAVALEESAIGKELAALRRAGKASAGDADTAKGLKDFLRGYINAS
ncbi:MAG: hypothetical protein HZA03_11175 [Nitrospinae bacterium]|nr:hypothetical protein [Nitrospinota bacterium]